MAKKIWLTEKFTPYEEHRHQVKKILVTKKTKFQKAEIIDTYTYNRCLVLDGELQSAALDEFIYHESLVHPGMLFHKKPENVLILGGGEGATLREVLKHKTLKNVVMVDIDGEVVNFCKKYLASFHKKAFNDKRVKLVIDDAMKYINETKEKFDLIISDLSCPIKDTPAENLYTKEFYKKITKCLSKNGIFVVQSGPADLPQITLHSMVYTTLKKVFRNAEPCYAFVPSFDVPWSFIVASNNKQELKKINTIDKLIKERIKGELKFYDGETHISIFNTPKYIRQILAKNKKIITGNKLAFLYK